jgi:4-amino-4-deoxy-L-arabinose transferase-like glycosyltransferase
MMGVAFGSAGVFIAVGAAGRRWGAGAAWVSGLILALSPTAITQTVDITDYPLFLFFASLACDALLRLADDEGGTRRATWIRLTAACILGCYSHFFGIVMSGAVFLAALWITVRRREPFRPWATAVLVIGLAFLGLIPFIRSAVDFGDEVWVPDSALRASIRLLYRLIGGHPAVMVYRPFMICTIAGSLVLVGIALASGEGRGRGARAALLAIGAGLVVTVLSRFLVHRFDPMTPVYSLWTAPLLAVACGSAVVARRDRWRVAAVAAAVLVAVGNLGAATVLTVHGSTFAHLPSRRISAQVAERGSPSRVTVIHEQREDWGYLYYPLRYRFGAGLRQLLALPEKDGTVSLRGLPDRGAEPLPAGSEDRLALISMRHASAWDLAAYIRSARTPDFPDDRISRYLEQTGWQLESREILMATAAAQVRWFRRKLP